MAKKQKGNKKEKSKKEPPIKKDKENVKKITSKK